VAPSSMHSLAVIGPGKVLAGANHQEFSSLPVRDRLVNASLSWVVGLFNFHRP
jgi:hypothetical protein